MRTSDRGQVRVAVDAYFARHPHTGSGQYLAQLLAALPAAAPDCVLSPYEPDGRGRAVNATVPDASGAGEGGRRQSRPLISRRLHPLAKLYFEQVSLPRTAARASDVLHYPYWAGPLRGALPTVVTVHDLIPLLLPSYRGPFVARGYTRLVAATSRHATMIVADSAATKRDILAHLRVPAERVQVIYLAADERFRPPADPGGVATARRAYDLAGPFVFYVGGLDARKNVPSLMAAFTRAKASLPAGCVLAVAGDAARRGPLFPDLPALARTLGIADVVRFLGVVPEDDLPALYQTAAAVAFPSTYEGFGLPPLEALACAAPLLCSRASSLPEVVGDAAVLLDPHDEDAWANALVRVLGDEGLRAELRRRGPAQAARFSWQTTAGETAAVYHEALARWQSSKGSRRARGDALQSAGGRRVPEEG